MTTTNNIVCAQLRSKLQNLETRLKIAKPLDIKPIGSKDMPSAGTDRNTSAEDLEKQIVEVKAELDKKLEALPKNFTIAELGASGPPSEKLENLVSNGST